MGNKASGFGQILTMALFALSVFAITLFLWLSFGGQIPLKPQQYRIKVPLTEGAQLVSEADVRISGVNVGRVKKETLDPGGARSLAEMEIEEPYAPIPADTRAILRDKTLLGETYIELSPGDPNAETLPENATLPQAQVDEQVQFEEVGPVHGEGGEVAEGVVHVLARSPAEGVGRARHPLAEGLLGLGVEDPQDLVELHLLVDLGLGQGRVLGQGLRVWVAR